METGCATRERASVVTGVVTMAGGAIAGWCAEHGGWAAARGRAPVALCHGMCHRLEVPWHSVAQALVQVSKVFHKRVDVIYLKVCHIIYSV